MDNTYVVGRVSLCDTKRSRLLFSALILLLVSFNVLRADDNGSEGNDNEKQYVVSKMPTPPCPHPQFHEIEEAVVAVPAGSTIRVCAGVYQLQVTINKPLTILGDTGAVLQPTSATANGTDFDTMGHPPIIALLAVKNTHDVTINDLTVDGSTVGATLMSCGSTYVGVLYQNASGSLTNMAVRNIKQAPVAQGCQSGLGVFVESQGGTSRVDILDSSVHDYQKNGITAKDAGTNVDIRHNYVSGIGSTPVIAQNGIEIGAGASGEIENNFVDNHLYASCTEPDPKHCPYIATNILVYNSNGISVTNNTSGTSQVGIYILGNTAHVQANNVWDDHVFDGIDLVGNNSQAQGNNIFHSDSDGVYVEGSNNQVADNVINEAAIGVEVALGSNNSINGNKYYNVLVPTKDPAPKQIKVSPY